MFYSLKEILFFVCLVDRFQKSWTEITEEFNTLLNQNQSDESLRKLFDEISKQGNLEFYRFIITKENYQSKLRRMKVFFFFILDLNYAESSGPKYFRN